MYVKNLKSGKKIKFCSCGMPIGATTKRKSTCGDSRCIEEEKRHAIRR